MRLPESQRHGYVHTGYAAGGRTSSTVPSCTSAQRRDIRWLLKNRGLPTCFITDQHREFFERAGIAWSYGAALESTLRSVSHAAAARLIAAIRETV